VSVNYKNNSYGSAAVKLKYLAQLIKELTRFKTALHTSWVKCSVCFFYYRSLTLVRAGVNQRQWAIIKETKTYN